MKAEIKRVRADSRKQEELLKKDWDESKKKSLKLRTTGPVPLSTGNSAEVMQGLGVAGQYFWFLFFLST